MAAINTSVTLGLKFQLSRQKENLGAFAKVSTVTTSFVMSVSSSIYLWVRMEQLDSHWKDFHENLYMGIFRKSAAKIQVSLKF